VIAGNNTARLSIANLGGAQHCAVAMLVTKRVTKDVKIIAIAAERIGRA
jgi:hypothetical protein